MGANRKTEFNAVAVVVFSVLSTPRRERQPAGPTGGFSHAALLLLVQTHARVQGWVDLVPPGFGGGNRKKVALQESTEQAKGIFEIRLKHINMGKSPFGPKFSAAKHFLIKNRSFLDKT